MNLEDNAREYALKCHERTNHLYDGQPYSVHLNMVVNVASAYIGFIPDDHRGNVIAACWCHDVIEDCRQTYSDVAKATNKEVADIVYAVTNEKGRNRRARANAKYYQGIRETPYALFVKLCDRYANVQYSAHHNSSALEMYRKEHDSFMYELHRIEYQPLITKLKDLTFDIL